MISPHTVALRPPHVSVQFGDGEHSFLLAQGTTFEELADRIAELTVLHNGAPLAVHVEFDTAHMRIAPTMMSPATTLPH